MGKSLDYKYVKMIIEKRGGKLLSKIYTNNKSHIRVKCCKCNKIWSPTFAIIKRGSWCPVCGSIKQSKQTRLDFNYISKIVNKNGYDLLSNEHKNVNKKLHICCKRSGHKKFAFFCHIRNGQKCRLCNTEDARAKFEKQVKKGIESRNGVMLSKYTSAHVKIQIMCKNCNSVWCASWANISVGKWCPQCASGKTQRKLVKIIKDILPCDSTVNVNYKDLDWLYNKKTKKKQEIDIYIPSLKLAIEYDGQQHFFPVCFGGMDKEEAKRRFERAKYNDRRKNRLMKKHTEDVEYFIRFNYKEKLTKEYVVEKLRKSGIPINDND